MRKGNSWGPLRVFTLSFQILQQGDTQTAFLPWDGKRGSGRREFQQEEDVPVSKAGTGEMAGTPPSPSESPPSHRGALCTPQPYSEG